MTAELDDHDQLDSTNAQTDASDPCHAQVDHASRSRRFAIDVACALVIFLVALGLRVVYVDQLRSNPMFDHPVMDELYHDQWAWSIAQGEEFVEGPYFRAPLYPAFLGLIYKFAGHDYFIPRLVQSVMGSISCVLLFVLGRAVFGRFVGFLAGFAAATYWMLIYFDGELLIPTLLVFLDLILLLLLMLSCKEPRKWFMLLAGLVLGLSAIARPNILLFAPAIAFWYLVCHRTQIKLAMICAAMLTVGCLAVVLPVTIRNWTIGEDPVLIASQGGVNFFIGNNEQSDGRTAIVPGTPDGWWEGYYATIRRAEQERGRELKASEVSDFYYEQAWDFIRAEPKAFFDLMLLKTRLFWTRHEISNNKGIYFWTEQFTPILQRLPLGFAVIAPLGLMGMALSLRKPIHLFPLWGFVVIYAFSVILFFCTARYRIPLIPVLLIFAAFALLESAKAIWSLKWLTLVAGTVSLGLGTALVWFTPETSPFRNDAFSFVRLGTTYDKLGESEKAISTYQDAIELQPQFVTAHFNLGLMLRKTGMKAKAAESFQDVIDARPYRLLGETDEIFSEAHFYLADHAYERRDFEEAAQHYREAIRLDPITRAGRLQYNLAQVLKELGQQDEARQQFALAIEPLRRQTIHDRADARLWNALGRSLFETKQLAASIEPLRRANTMKPDNPLTISQLSQALIATRQYEQAISLLKHSLHLPNPFIRNRLTLLLSAVPQDQLRDSARALQLAKELCPSPPNCSPRYLDTIGVVMADMGRFEEAIRFAGEAIRVLTQSNEPRMQALLPEVRSRHAGYQSRVPFRLPD